MRLPSAIEKYLGRKIDFTSEIILRDSGDGNLTIAEWNVPEVQPTLDALTTLYNNNKIAMDIDASVRDGNLVRVVIDGGTAGTYATGYIETLEVTQADWNTYNNYVSSINAGIPENLLTTNSQITVKATPCPLVTTRYINNKSNTSLDNSSNMVIFNNDNKNVNVYLPAITTDNHGFIFYIKNASRNASIYLYPTKATNLIENSSGLYLVSGKGVILATCYNTQTYMILGSY